MKAFDFAESMLIGAGTIIASVMFLTAVLAAIAVYQWARRKLNKPLIGSDVFLIKLLERDDYVCIDGKVMRFIYIVRKGDRTHLPSGYLAFQRTGLGYDYYPPSVMQHCEFIMGKYGLKWAASNQWANLASDKVEQYHRI